MKQAKLKDLFDYLPKSKIKAGAGLKEGKYPFYTSSENQSKYLNDFQYEPSCLVFGTGGKASLHLTTTHFSTSTDCITVKPKPDVGINIEYVFHYLKGNMQILENGFKGAGLKHISKAYISEIQIPYPKEISDQIRIVYLLNKVEKLIAQRKQHLQQFDDLLKSIFLEMFGNPILNERGWNKIQFSDLLVEIDSGKSPKCEVREATKDEWGVLKLGAVTRCEFDETENKALPNDIPPTIRHEVKVGDLLFSRKNTYELVAACAYVFKTRPKLLMPDLIFRFIFKESAEINPIFIWKLLTNNSQRKIIQALATGAAGSMPNISKANLKKVFLPIPPLELQNQFAVIVEKIERIKSHYQESLNNLEQLNGVLYQYAFKGQLDLSKITPHYQEVIQDSPIEECTIGTSNIKEMPKIELSKPDFLISELDSSKNLVLLLNHWLEEYYHQLDEATFSIKNFIEAVQIHLTEYHPEHELELSSNDYEHIKSWVFEALSRGRLAQVFDDTNNSIHLKVI